MIGQDQRIVPSGTAFFSSEGYVKGGTHATTNFSMQPQVSWISRLPVSDSRYAEQYQGKKCG